jgi:hypothetical protein
MRIPFAEMTAGELPEIPQHRLRYNIKKVAKCLKKLGATLPDGQDPVRLLYWLAKNVEFSARP